MPLRSLRDMCVDKAADLVRTCVYISEESCAGPHTEVGSPEAPVHPLEDQAHVTPKHVENRFAETFPSERTRLEEGHSSNRFHPARPRDIPCSIQLTDEIQDSWQRLSQAPLLLETVCRNQPPSDIVRIEEALGSSIRTGEVRHLLQEIFPGKQFQQVLTLFDRRRVGISLIGANLDDFLDRALNPGAWHKANPGQKMHLLMIVDFPTEKLVDAEGEVVQDQPELKALNVFCKPSRLPQGQVSTSSRVPNLEAEFTDGDHWQFDDHELMRNLPGAWRNPHKPWNRPQMRILHDLEKWGYQNRKLFAYSNSYNYRGSLVKTDTSSDILVEWILPEASPKRDPEGWKKRVNSSGENTLSHRFGAKGRVWKPAYHMLFPFTHLAEREDLLNPDLESRPRSISYLNLHEPSWEVRQSFADVGDMYSPRSDLDHIRCDGQHHAMLRIAYVVNRGEALSQNGEQLEHRYLGRVRIWPQRGYRTCTHGPHPTGEICACSPGVIDWIAIPLFRCCYWNFVSDDHHQMELSLLNQTRPCSDRCTCRLLLNSETTLPSTDEGSTENEVVQIDDEEWFLKSAEPTDRKLCLSPTGPLLRLRDPQPLPPGWVARLSTIGRVYFVEDCDGGRRQWQDPRASWG